MHSNILLQKADAAVERRPGSSQLRTVRVAVEILC